jgi:hypothetical protein
MMSDNPSAKIESRLERWAASQPAAPLRPEMERRLQSLLAASLTPVKPLPSQGWLVLAFLFVFVVCAAGLMAIMDKAGFHLMTGAQMARMTTILTGGGVLFSLAVAWRMAPGTRHRFSLSFVLAVACPAVLGGIGLLFPWRASHAFVSEGWPCAVMELMIAVPAAAVFWLLARRGALFVSASLGASVAGLAVCLALTPLQFQCMFQQAPHLLVWHAGTAAILIGIGALIAKSR